ncbi:MAG TPA: hypothetical protein VK487_03155 [Candidatus Bathyarchaeia archaeon]|nr:hypothetical protein [Candidatus Bathyarchaeia archaeon]
MTNDLETTKTLLNDFLVLMDNRTTFFLVSNEKVLPKFLEWNLVIWKNTLQSSLRKSGDLVNWFELSKTSESTILKIGERAIKEGQYLFTLFFLKNFQKHVEAHKEESIQIEKERRYYVEYMFDFLFKLLAEFVEVDNLNEKEFMWSNFPAEWKITKDNLEDKRNLFARISLYKFLDWASTRIQMGRDFDPELNDLSVNLFPDVDPRVWAVILIFCTLAFDPNNRVRSVIEQPWSFGYDFGAAVYSFSGEEPTERQLETVRLQKEAVRKVKTQKAYELAILLFPSVFERELLTKYIEEASHLKFEEDHARDHKRIAMLKIFNEMLENQPAPNPNVG